MPLVPSTLSWWVMSVSDRYVIRFFLGASYNGIYAIATKFPSVLQTFFDTLEGIDAETDQIAHITITACHVVHRAADVLTTSKGQFRPVLIEHMELSVDIILQRVVPQSWQY